MIGLWVGVLPGLGGPVAMAILIPFTFSMDPLSALLMLASISVGAAFGGSIIDPAQHPGRGLVGRHRL